MASCLARCHEAAKRIACVALVRTCWQCAMDGGCPSNNGPAGRLSERQAVTTAVTWGHCNPISTSSDLALKGCSFSFVVGAGEHNSGAVMSSPVIRPIAQNARRAVASFSIRIKERAVAPDRHDTPAAIYLNAQVGRLPSSLAVRRRRGCKAPNRRAINSALRRPITAARPRKGAFCRCMTNA